MDIAFDCYSGEIISASRVEGSTADQPFRFICASCGQSVKVAAKESGYQRTHFRHLHGNNDTECENYLGKEIRFYGLKGLSEKVKRFYKKQIDFYFSKTSRRLLLGIKFSKEEIEEYQKNNTSLTISKSTKEDPFFSRKINKTNFAIDCCEKIGLDTYSPNYIIGLDKERMIWSYPVFNSCCPSFFKKSESDTEEITKYVKGDTVYTNCIYYILKPSGNKPEIELKKIPSVEIIDSCKFKIDRSGETIYIVETRFNEITDELKRILKMWGKKIEKSEQLDLLWPPAFEIEDKLFLNSKRVYLQSSFALESNKSINVNQEDIIRLSESLYSVKNNYELKIRCKNVDFTLEQREWFCGNELIEQKTDYITKFKVPDVNQFYLFSDDGVKKLIPGQTIYLTPNTQICEYLNNYKIKTIIFEENKQLIGEELFRDILANNNQQIPFDFSVTSEQPTYLREYLNFCEQVGTINAIVARCIEEGMF